jgi:hypothetical protein
LLDHLMSDLVDRPFGALEVMSGQTMQARSFAAQQAAENLLAKARHALDNDDPDRARRFADRAARLPFDEHEVVAPAALAVHMELFCAVADAVEEAEPDDSRWLEAALVVLSGADQAAACDLRDVLVAINADFALRSREHARIRDAIAAVPDRAELRDLDLSAPQLCDQVLSVLDALRAYETTLTALAD